MEVAVLIERHQPQHGPPAHQREPVHPDPLNGCVEPIRKAMQSTAPNLPYADVQTFEAAGTAGPTLERGRDAVRGVRRAGARDRRRRRELRSADHYWNAVWH